MAPAAGRAGCLAVAHTCLPSCRRRWASSACRAGSQCVAHCCQPCEHRLHDTAQPAAALPGASCTATHQPPACAGPSRPPCARSAPSARAGASPAATPAPLGPWSGCAACASPARCGTGLLRSLAVPVGALLLLVVCRCLHSGGSNSPTGIPGDRLAHASGPAACCAIPPKLCACVQPRWLRQASRAQGRRPGVRPSGRAGSAPPRSPRTTTRPSRPATATPTAPRRSATGSSTGAPSHCCCLTLPCNSPGRASSEAGVQQQQVQRCSAAAAA